MKLFHTVILSLFFLVPTWSLAQRSDFYSVEIGEEYRDDILNYPPDVIGVDDAGYYIFQNKAPLIVLVGIVAFKATKERRYLRRFNHKLTPEKSVEIDLGKGKMQEYPLQIAMAPEGQLFLFSSQTEKRARLTRLLLRRIDRKSLDIPAKGEQLIEIDYSDFSKNSDPYFGISYSRDSSKIMVHYFLPGKRDDHERLVIHTFNDEMIPLWNREFELDYDRELFRSRGLIIGNDAQVYMLSKIYQQKGKERIGDAANYSFKILQMNPSLEQPDEIDLSLDGRFLNDVHLGIWPDGNLVCSGIYSEERINQVKGLYFLTIDGVRNSIIKESYEPLSLSMFKEEVEEDDKPKSARKEKKKEKREQRELASYEFDDMILRSDGGALIVGEKSYTTTTSYYNSNTGSWTTRTVFHHDDIVVIHISQEGDIEQVDVIPKKQAMTSSNYLLSYALSVNGNRINFVYNDKLENLDVPEGKSPRTYVPSLFGKKKNTVVLASLGPNGEVSRHSAISQAETRQFAVPMASMQVSSNETIMVFQKGKIKRLARITFE